MHLAEMSARNGSQYRKSFVSSCPYFSGEPSENMLEHTLQRFEMLMLQCCTGGGR